ncbi:MAG: hypothetical protein Q4B65_00705, partial [Candidatus Saccharibacteria bacterium]|nr:hypothetical protein [Candidatus Saccharibacteria bacterium]
LALIGMAAIVGIYAYLAKLWQCDGASFKEWAAFFILGILLYFPAMSAAHMAVSLISGPFISSIILLIPKLAFWIYVFFTVINACDFRRDEAEKERKMLKRAGTTGATATTPEGGDPDDDSDEEELTEEDLENRRDAWNIAGWAAKILAVIVVIALIWTGLNWSSLSNPKQTSQTKAEYPFFHNAELLSDSDPDNDYNFGYEFKDGEKEISAKAYAADHRARMKIDPVLGVATIGYHDMITKTRFLGEFYDQYPNDKTAALNHAVDFYVGDQEAYNELLDTYFAVLDTAEVSLETGTGIKDQMYMNPYTEDGVPDIVVYETDQTEGKFLVYTFKIKNNPIKVMYRIECGYQPTNVASLMGVTPKKPATPAKTTTPSSGTPSKNPTPSTSTPTKNPPAVKKDPSKGTQGTVVAPNDNPGPGKDTNNGYGATESSKHPEESSTDMSSIYEYRQTIDEMNQDHDGQKVGGDPNTPTVSSPNDSGNRYYDDYYRDDDYRGTNVDNNGDRGTGNGGIDKPTPVRDSAETSSGKDIKDEGYGNAWGGPPDA